MQILKDRPDNFATLQHQNNFLMHECNYYNSYVGIILKIQIFPTEPQYQFDIDKKDSGKPGVMRA